MDLGAAMALKGRDVDPEALVPRDSTVISDAQQTARGFAIGFGNGSKLKTINGTTDFSLFLVLTCINHLTIGVSNFDSYPIVRIFVLQSFRPLASLAIAKASSRDNFLEVIALRHVFFGKKVLRSSRIPSFSRLYSSLSKLTR